MNGLEGYEPLVFINPIMINTLEGLSNLNFHRNPVSWILLYLKSGMLNREAELLTPTVNHVQWKFPRRRLFSLRSEILSFFCVFSFISPTYFSGSNLASPSSRKTSLILEDGLHSPLIFRLISIYHFSLCPEISGTPHRLYIVFLSFFLSFFFFLSSGQRLDLFSSPEVKDPSVQYLSFSRVVLTYEAMRAPSYAARHRQPDPHGGVCLGGLR